MEKGRTMLLHATIIGVVLYGAMLMMGQNKNIAENRSIIIAAMILIYMILFGHKLPKFNK